MLKFCIWFLDIFLMRVVRYFPTSYYPFNIYENALITYIQADTFSLKLHIKSQFFCFGIEKVSYYFYLLCLKLKPQPFCAMVLSTQTQSIFISLLKLSLFSRRVFTSLLVPTADSIEEFYFQIHCWRIYSVDKENFIYSFSSVYHKLFFLMQQ